MSSAAYQQKAIADYAMIGDLQSAALVAKNGTIDWFCPQRFDSPACFAALLGRAEHGYWSLAPATAEVEISRRYLPGTLILQTTFTTATGAVELLDYMPLHAGGHIMRELRCIAGEVAMSMTCRPGFHYGKTPAQAKLVDQCLEFTPLEGAAERLRITGDLPFIAKADGSGQADFTLAEGQGRFIALSYANAGEEFAKLPPQADAAEDCANWWRQWISRSSYQGPWKHAVDRSLILLKAMTYLPTGAIIAAPTSSLPEIAGGTANWDYRFTWLRDAALVLDVLLRCGFQAEAREWRNWLVDAVSRSNNHIKTFYTIDGKVFADEQELGWLPGYHGAQPVRLGNAASRQFQLDISGELVQVLYLARKSGLEAEPGFWQLQCEVLKTIANKWREPDAGIWETRGEPQHYVHSKVLAWLAFDRSLKDAADYGFDAPIDDWRRTRDEIHRDICSKGLHQDNYFVRCYGSTEMDASLLMIPLLGFLPADDPRVVKTLEQIEQRLCSAEGFVYRNELSRNSNEATFMACSYWLADVYMLVGRQQQAKALFERLLEISNDVDLLSEEYDPKVRCLMGNFPQSFSHLGLINSALLIGAVESHHDA